jgi:hypothetical protein
MENLNIFPNGFVGTVARAEVPDYMLSINTCVVYTYTCVCVHVLLSKDVFRCCIRKSVYEYMHSCLLVCMYVCMYVCIYVCVDDV